MNNGPHQFMQYNNGPVFHPPQTQFVQQYHHQPPQFYNQPAPQQMYPQFPPQHYPQNFNTQPQYQLQFQNQPSYHALAPLNVLMNAPPLTHEVQPVPPDPFSPIPAVPSVVAKKRILEEIVRECEEIERRSNSSGSSGFSSPISNWSSEERETPSPRVKKSYHPYKTPEKKERKKAQNRLAATRYREKKRREKEQAMTCIEGLTEINVKFKDQVAELEREIRYFKKFMSEMGMKHPQLLF